MDEILWDFVIFGGTITDAKLNLARSVKLEVFSVDSKNSHTMQLAVTYLYTGVHVLVVLRTIF